MTTDENLHKVFQINVVDNTLRIETTHCIKSSKKIEILINFTTLESIVITNDAALVSVGKLKVNALTITASEKCKFDLEVKAEDVVVIMRGKAEGELDIRSSNLNIDMNERTELDAKINTNLTTVKLTRVAELKLKGDSDAAAYTLKDRSELDGKKMKAATVTVQSSNRAESTVFAKKNVEITSEDKSIVYVYGAPIVDVTELSDKAKIIKK